ncbi:kinetochore protein spc24-like [Dendronephthya gigantea]|uniref:kinetochore protein spc24-like n=1 Tax=Dendronephthya gigantea TaxID=151771 RepID=UPI00106C8D07|nr:kinetochore protein spc24-like [Dendronephthya gigantea]
MSSEELRQTAKMLAKALDSGDDYKQLLKAIEGAKNNSELIKQRNMEVKRCVQALAMLEEKTGKMAAMGIQESKENDEIIAKLKEEKQSRAGEIEKLNAALTSLENSIREIGLENSKLLEEKSAIQHQASDAMPKTKFSFSLYSNITRLRWDYDMDDDKLQGFVTSLHDVRPFTLNLKEHSRHFVANYLWDVIASAKSSQQ